MLIDVHNLEKRYNDDDTMTRALNGVSFSIAQGEFVAIMGPSGSGKSTLLHILSFLDRPTEGSYHFDGKAMIDMNDEELAMTRNKKMGFVFQSFNLLPRTSVLANVELPLVYAGTSARMRREKALAVIQKVGLSHRAHHLSSQLSGGERQRVAIARALVNEPSIIFADEPTGNLDSASGRQVMELIVELHTTGHTIVFVTHDSGNAGYAHRMLRMRDGKIESDTAIHH